MTNTNNNNDAKRTHTAWTFKREGKKFPKLVPLEIGKGWIDKENNRSHLFLDRLPIGGFTGYVMLVLNGETPPVAQPQPRRPDQQEEGEDFEE